MFFFEDIDFSDSMEQGELPKAVNDYTKDVQPPLPKADEKDVESPQTEDDKTEVFESELAKDDDKESELLLSETRIEQPSVAKKDELGDIAPPLENKENFEKVENMPVKDHNLEHSLAEPGSQEQVQSLSGRGDIIDAQSSLAEPGHQEKDEDPAVRSDTIDVQSPLDKPGNSEHVEPTLTGNEDTATAGKLCSFVLYVPVSCSSSISYSLHHNSYFQF